MVDTNLVLARSAQVRPPPTTLMMLGELPNVLAVLLENREMRATIISSELVVVSVTEADVADVGVLVPA
ncbi:hypothetical protein CK219_00380 [Mesorhizobium sp. WSM4313]|nr:hypothetical protein CK219_00380 [Mesorhizobium sp. WSM4313]